MRHTVNIPYFTTRIMNGEFSLDDYLKAKEMEGIALREKQSIDLIL